MLVAVLALTGAAMCPRLWWVPSSSSRPHTLPLAMTLPSAGRLTACCATSPGGPRPCNLPPGSPRTSAGRAFTSSAETCAGQHGVASAAVAARLGLECAVYMGTEDMERQHLNVVRMRLLGAEVIGVDAGSRTL